MPIPLRNNRTDNKRARSRLSALPSWTHRRDTETSLRESNVVVCLLDSYFTPQHTRLWSRTPQTPMSAMYSAKLSSGIGPAQKAGP